jgi:tetratricopeptide (TPR) repeat protein
MLSHILDCQLYGLKPAGHHLTSVVLHALNVALVFLLLWQVTGAVWRSFLVAALFAVHPLRVESVAWIAERKDVLSGCFGLFTLIFYARYVKQCKMQNAKCRFFSYGMALFFLALGLMSKPMLVTWPFVMLLLDYWPLQRFQLSAFSFQNLKTLLLEKIPFFALAAVASVVTFLVQQHTGAMVVGEKIPLGDRAGNALISGCRYLGKLFWPTDLANPYPYPGHWPVAQVLQAGGLLLGLSALLFALGRRYPFLLMGWLWFGGALVPVIGLVQVGEQSMADRYTYLPSLGVLIGFIWGAYELARPWRFAVVGCSVAAGAAMGLCLALTRQQIGYWRDSEALFTHALKVTPDNYLAYNNLGVALNDHGRTDEAIRLFQNALRLRPDDVAAYNNLGAAFARKGQFDAAIAQYQEAIRRRPDEVTYRFNLGTALFSQGRNQAAIEQFQAALRRQPDYAEAHFNLGAILVQEGRVGEASSHFNAAVRLQPDDAAGHYSLALTLAYNGRTDAAIAQYQEAIRLKPDYAEAHNNLGAVLGRIGRLDEAIGQFQEAVRLRPDYTEARANLAQVISMKNASTGRGNPGEPVKGAEK